MRERKIYFVITVDTEADHSRDWRKSKPLRFDSVLKAVPETLEPLFDRYGAVGTYLLTVEVLEDGAALEVISHLNRPHELGTHLHPEFVQPGKKYFDYAGVKGGEFSTSYDPPTERAKIRTITELFKEKMGYAPRVYRGGKFGFNAHTARSLIELGYLVDTSVTPRVSWRDIGGPDFRPFRSKPFLIRPEGCGGSLLEVPVSIEYSSLASRLLNRPVWLRPSFNSAKDMKRLIDGLIGDCAGEEGVALNMMFHSMEFYPAASPYSQDAEGCRRLLDRVKEILAYCSGLGARFTGLSGLREVYESSAEIADKTGALQR